MNDENLCPYCGEEMEQKTLIDFVNDESIEYDYCPDCDYRQM